MKEFRDIEFVSNKVLLPAEKVWCGVLEPSGVVIGLATSEGDIECLLGRLYIDIKDFGEKFGGVTNASVSIVTAAEILKRRRKEKKKAKRLKAVG